MSLNNFDIAHTSKEFEFTDNRNNEQSSSENSLTQKLSKKIDNTAPVKIKTMNEDNKKEHLYEFTSGSDNAAQKEMILNDDLNDRSKNEKFESHSFNTNHTMTLIDVTICSTVLGPSIIGFWRGAWNLLGLYHEMFPIWLCFTFSILFHTLFAVTKYHLHDYVNDKLKTNSLSNQILCQIIKIIYTLVFGLVCITHWMYSWIILDEYLHIHRLWINASLTTLFLSALMRLRCIRNLLAPPLCINIDTYNRFFLFPTLFKRNTRGWSLYLLDCAFSVGVVGTLVVFVWRGVWILFDLYLIPDHREHSALGSLAIGYVIVIVTFSLQPLMRHVCARLEGLPRLIAADAFLLLSFLGTVNVWRGIWNLLDLWLLPNNLVLSCWITSVGCFVFLLLLNCSNSILVRGVYIDAEEEEGKCVIFPCHYLRLFFKIEREKKEARRRNLLNTSKDFASCTDGTGKDPENGALLQNSTSTTIIQGNPESLV